MTLLIGMRGEPCGQPRPRFVAGRVVSTLRGSKASLWRETVAKACRAAPSPPVSSAAIDVEMTFWLQTKNASRAGNWHYGKPDADNLAKLVLDVMQDCGIIVDDKQVAKLTVHKLWATRPGAKIQIKPATPLGPVATHLDTEGLGSGGKPEWLN